MASPKKYRLAYLVSHPIQYQAPLLRYLTENSDMDLTVFFLSDFSVRGYQDPGFGASVVWDVPLLDGYKHVFLPALGSTARVSPLRPFVYGLAKHLRAGQFDALWLHGYAHQASLRALLIAKSLGMKVFVRSDAQLISAAGSARTRQIKEPILRRLFQSVDCFLAVGTRNAQYFQHFGVPASKIKVMPYAVDNQFFQERVQQAFPERETLRAQLGLEPGRPIILFASKFVARKRADDLLEAYARLSPDGIAEPYPYLLFVGDGEQRPQLEARVQALGWSSVRFAGFKNQTELPRYFDLCDVFVLPSSNEPWGLIINEVMNAAKPVILTEAVGCAPDLVQDGKNGYVIQVGDIEMLADRLKTITADLALAKRMGGESLAMIDRWGFRENLEALMEVLDKTVGPRPFPVAR